MATALETADSSCHHGLLLPAGGVVNDGSPAHDVKKPHGAHFQQRRYWEGHSRRARPEGAHHNATCRRFRPSQAGLHQDQRRNVADRNCSSSRNFDWRAPCRSCCMKLLLQSRGEINISSLPSMHSSPLQPLIAPKAGSHVQGPPSNVLVPCLRCCHQHRYETKGQAEIHQGMPPWVRQPRKTPRGCLGPPPLPPSPQQKLTGACRGAPGTFQASLVLCTWLPGQALSKWQVGLGRTRCFWEPCHTLMPPPAVARPVQWKFGNHQRGQDDGGHFSWKT